jgi:hypothetical protein
MHHYLPSTTHPSTNTAEYLLLSKPRRCCCKSVLQAGTGAHQIFMRIRTASISSNHRNPGCHPVLDLGCFTSNQTGNTVLFAVGVLLEERCQAPSFVISTIAVFLGFSSLGVLVTGQISYYFEVGQTRRSLVLSSVMQTILVHLAGGLHVHHISTIRPDTTMARVLVGSLAFSSGSQVVVRVGLEGSNRGLEDSRTELHCAMEIGD